MLLRLWTPHQTLEGRGVLHYKTILTKQRNSWIDKYNQPKQIFLLNFETQYGANDQSFTGVTCNCHLWHLDDRLKSFLDVLTSCNAERQWVKRTYLIGKTNIVGQPRVFLGFGEIKQNTKALLSYNIDMEFCDFVELCADYVPILNLIQHCS